MATVSAALKERIRNPEVLKRVVPAESLIPHFQNGQLLGWSGFTAVGSCKEMPLTLANHIEKNKLQGQMRFKLFAGASTGHVENIWAGLDMIERRWPFQVGKNINKGINEGKIEFGDIHLGMFTQNLQYGYLTKGKGPSESKNLDIGIIEATAILPDGSLVPSAAVGANPEIIANAKKLIIEVNTSIPDLTGLHDIYLPVDPPHRQPIPITSVSDRVGTIGIPIPWEKVVGVVESTQRDVTGMMEAGDEVSSKIASHILEFFKHEIKFGRLPKNLLPLQSGIGTIANAVVFGLNNSDLEDLTVWTEVCQDSFLDLFDSGKLKKASSISLSLSPVGFERFYNGYENYKNKIVLRPQTIANNCELIRRMGVIAMNTPVEVDMYGHANSTCVAGSRMMNGLGGSGDFLRNAKLSIMHTPSSRPTKTDPTGISCVMPMCSHVDHTEHDLDVIVTEQGLADLRGLTPKERAVEVIDKCAHPDYKPILMDYFNMAYKECLAKKMAHEPQMLSKAFRMYENLEKKGTMKVASWD